MPLWTRIELTSADVIVSFPFHVPIPVPRALWDAFLGGLCKLRIISPLPDNGSEKGSGRWVVLHFHVSTVMAPLYACLFLLAILAIGRREVYDGLWVAISL
jgi:hypothetical protein